MRCVNKSRPVETQQVQPPYDINGLLQRLETIGERIAATDREKQKQLIGALFTRLETKKNGSGEWIISSAVVRPIFADFFKDLKKVRQSVPPKDLEGTHANRATRRVDGLSCLLTRAGFHILGLLVGRYITIACDCQLLNAVRPPHFVAVRCLGKHRLHPDHAPSRVRWT